MCYVCDKKWNQRPHFDQQRKMYDIFTCETCTTWLTLFINCDSYKIRIFKLKNAISVKCNEMISVRLVETMSLPWRQTNWEVMTCHCNLKHCANVADNVLFMMQLYLHDAHVLIIQNTEGHWLNRIKYVQE